MDHSLTASSICGLIISVNRIIRLIREREDDAERIKQRHGYCKKGRLIGAGMGLLGGVAVVAAPFTGGASAVVGYLAIGAVGVGTVTSLASSVVDYFGSKEFQNDIGNLIFESRDVFERLQCLLQQADSCLEGDSSLRTLVRGGRIASSGVMAYQNVVGASNAIRYAREVMAVNNAPPSLVTRIMGYVPYGSEISSGVTSSLRSMGFNVGSQATASASRAVLTAAGQSLLVVANIVDLAIIIRKWNVEHPSVQTVRQVLGFLQQSVIVLEQLSSHY